MTDLGALRYINWDSIVQQSPELQRLLSEETLEKCQKEITARLKGVHPQNRDIIVTKRVISDVLFFVYDETKYTPKVGDIYTRYTQPIEFQRTDMDDIIQKTITIVVNDTRNQYETIKNNQRLSVWNTVYGDFNSEGLRAHPPIKTRQRRSERFQFHMNY